MSEHYMVLNAHSVSIYTIIKEHDDLYRARYNILFKILTFLW